VVCLALGGPAEMVTSETGILVEAADSEAVHRDLTKALEAIATEPALRRRLGAAGRARALAHYTWEAKGERLAAIYSRLTGTSDGVARGDDRMQT
jgi:glycosyltransferase involved in cell wall biosynthesis